MAYFTLKPETFTWEQEIKKSRFIVNFARVSNEADAQVFIERIGKQHDKARHNVFAYVLGDNDAIQRYSDNGEPSGTAGVPMLEVLKNNEIHDVVAVVTRYFGSIKLGAGGLIRAYAGTVADGLQAAGMVERLTRTAVTVKLDYKFVDSFQFWLREHGFQVINTAFGVQVALVVPVAKLDLPTFQADVTNLLGGQVAFKIGDDVHFEIDRK